MTNRCKAGDMAIVVSGQRNLGKIVTIVKPADRTDLVANIERTFGYVWEVDQQMQFVYRNTNKEVVLSVYPDRCLQPLPKLDEEDDLYSTTIIRKKETA